MTDADDVILSVAGLRVRDSWDREILHGLDLDAVSYTHLTLPTLSRV